MTAQRVALVTGAGRGIGAATVKLLALEGWAVVAVDSCTDDEAFPYSMSTKPELDEVVASGTGGDVVGYQADVRDVDALRDAVTLAEQRFGGLDAAIACAGVIGGGVPQWEVPLRVERAILEVNLGGVLNLARVAVPALIRRDEPRAGRFIAVASAAATRGMPMIAAYSAAKAGVAGLVRSLAVELGASGVTANSVSPGSTATAILNESARLYDLAAATQFADQQTFERLLEPSEVAQVIAFLAGAGSSAMTGAVVPVDGGLSL